LDLLEIARALLRPHLSLSLILLRVRVTSTSILCVGLPILGPTCWRNVRNDGGIYPYWVLAQCYRVRVPRFLLVQIAFGRLVMSNFKGHSGPASGSIGWDEARNSFKSYGGGRGVSASIYYVFFAPPPTQRSRGPHWKHPNSAMNSYN